MIDQIFAILAVIDAFYWEYIGFIFVVLAGIYFSFKSNFLQFNN
jgi:Na+/alanine symporter